MLKIFKIHILGLLVFFMPFTIVFADDSALFTSVAPDALILLDLSGSMTWTPAGGAATTTGLPCTANTCSRLDIAKTAIFKILDSDNNNYIDGNDEKNLNIRIGYMRFYNCGSDEPSVNFNNGCNTIKKNLGTQYTEIYCNKTTPNSCLITDGSGVCVKTESAVGGTPLSSSLAEAKSYLDHNKTNDQAKACRYKAVILITDGEDTFSCGGNGSTGSIGRRMSTVAKAKELADAGYKVFVVGFGSGMPLSLQNTLNWAAYFGQTDNPSVANSGSTSAVAVPSTPCSATDDPGANNLAGYAFLATSADELETAMKQALAMISSSTYSFSSAAIASTRTSDEDYLYEGSFQYIGNDPFWKGHLIKYQINTDGSVGNAIWDAGVVLDNTNSNSRNIYTLKSGVVTAFTTANINPSDLGVATTSIRDMVVGYFRGDSAYNFESWKLGDIFHSDPVVVGTPNLYFSDIININNVPTAYSAFRNDYERSTANGKRLILVGANDGQLHAFKTSDGAEAWSFIPPNLLSRLSQIAHNTHPSALTHTFYVDGPISQSDVWLGTGDGKTKSKSDWRTFIVFGEGRGGDKSLWSSSISCDIGFNDKYTTTYTNYCGYYALDITDTLSAPVYKWKISPSSADAPYLGQPWSKMAIGRVKINGEERWVGVIGAGYNAADCKTATCDTRGKGVFVVDMKNGAIIRSFTRAAYSSMDYSMPGQPAAIDKDGDGFLDTIYIGDLGGNMWKFSMCDKNASSSCNETNWTASLLFAASSGQIRPIYFKPVIAEDTYNNTWVYWGTGDDSDPTAANTQEKFYAVIDSGVSLTINDLDNITTGTFNPSTSNKKGWYINLSGSGEKILAQPTVFGGEVFFTTYTPANGNDPCDQSGTPLLYGVNYTTGAGIFTGSRSTAISGSGIASAAVVSVGPNSGAGLYITTSSSSSVTSTSKTQLNPYKPKWLTNPRILNYWRDLRVR